MRIKKKHVLLESLLIDISTEFTDTEKKILKSLNKKYGNPYGEGNTFNQWDVATWLIENLELPYDIAYELTKTYYWNYDKLFTNVEKVRKTIPIAELFFDNLGKLMVQFKDMIGENYGTINIKFKDDSIDDIREISFWDRYNGFGLYIPFNRWSHPDTGRYFTMEERNDRLIRVNATFKPIDKLGNIIDGWVGSKVYEETVNNDIFSVSIDIVIGESENNSRHYMDLKIPYPKPLSKETFNRTIKSIADQVLEKLSTMVFDLRKGVEPI